MTPTWKTIQVRDVPLERLRDVVEALFAASRLKLQHISDWDGGEYRAVPLDAPDEDQPDYLKGREP